MPTVVERHVSEPNAEKTTHATTVVQPQFLSHLGGRITSDQGTISRGHFIVSLDRDPLHDPNGSHTCCRWTNVWIAIDDI